MYKKVWLFSITKKNIFLCKLRNMPPIYYKPTTLLIYVNTSRTLFLRGLFDPIKPLGISINSTNEITRAHSEDIIIKNGHCSHKRTLCGWFKCDDEFIITTSLYPYFIFLSSFRDRFPQLPVQHRTECTCTDTLHSNPIFFFHGMCHKTQPQTNHHPSIDRQSIFKFHA